MTRLLIALAALSILASCAQYQEPQANCFTFMAAVAPVEPGALAAPVALAAQDCIFTPISGQESNLEI